MSTEKKKKEVTSLKTYALENFLNKSLTPKELSVIFGTLQSNIHYINNDSGYMLRNDKLLFWRIEKTKTYERLYVNARLEYEARFENEKLREEKWFTYKLNDPILHRDNDEPAWIMYDKDEKVLYKAWYKNGKEHRENDEPASIKYYANGRILHEFWYKNGEVYRDHGKPIIRKAKFNIKFGLQKIRNIERMMNLL